MSLVRVTDPQRPSPTREMIQVLIVEDNEADVRLAEESLLDAGQDHIQLTHVDLLSRAIQRLASEKFDVILLDLSLPDGQRLDGMRQIHTAYPHLPIVVLSGDQDESLALKALEQGAQDYLRKGEADGRGLVRAIRYAIERQRAEDRLAFLATHDPLTGLANRTLLRDRLEHALVRARRFDYPVHVLYLDLDGFKLANDRCGHTAGDHLLRAVADRIAASVRRADTVARIGGDEFVVVLEATAHVNDIEAITQKILKTLARPFEIQEHRIMLTCSIGLVGFPKDGDDGDQLLRHADCAMYRAKDAGGNQAYWYTSPDRSSRTARVNLGQDFRKALEREELLVYYQPQLNLRTNTVSMVNVLLRWNHPTAGILLPSMFIPIDEHGGQMLTVEQWLFETAARQYQMWKNESVWSFRLCIKLFPRQLASEHAVGDFIRSIERVGICPADLVVDLPGPSLGEDLDRDCAILDLLQRKGIQVALDNVGTKSWPIDAMRRLPWDILKIDPSLVQSGPQVLVDAVMLRMLVSLGSDLQRRVVAEGVADLAQLKYLLSVGCGEAMGDYICPPLSSQDMTAWLKKRNSLTVRRAA
jgi:diguanylate cyclase (GGDEF)-like protein